jgi:hypothetical protein
MSYKFRTIWIFHIFFFSWCQILRKNVIRIHSHISIETWMMYNCSWYSFLIWHLTRGAIVLFQIKGPFELKLCRKGLLMFLNIDFSIWYENIQYDNTTVWTKVFQEWCKWWYTKKFTLFCSNQISNMAAT